MNTERESARASHAARLSSRFDATASRYDLMVGLNPGYHAHLRTAARALVDRLPRGKDLFLADLGCGSGASTAALVGQVGARSTAEIEGIDASEGMIAVAKAKTWPSGVQFRVGAAEEIRPGTDGRRFDGILACYLFRNVVDRPATLATVARAIEPGGWLVVQEYSVARSVRATLLWTLVCWTVVIPLALVVTRETALYRYLWRSVLRFGTISRFEDQLRAAGFTDVATTTVGGWQRGILHTVVARRAR